MFSLRSVDAAFTGEGDGWTRAMTALRDRSLVRAEDVERVALLERFGRLIGNTDMHLGNVSVSVDGDVLRASPVHDMCTMALAPTRGEVRPFDPTLPVRAATREADTGDVLHARARELARRFWKRTRRETRASEELVDVAKAFLQQA